MNTAYTLIVRHCHNQLVARGWPASMEISANLSYRQGTASHFTAASIPMRYSLYCRF
ncbi:hypothetical protein [Ewingella americana]|uniref:hypothetical protein n=1 Tax=Ewingella americana TaxID=41202 RepID=UPI001639909F|nr:hypothetical protein [Ewingella americana]QMV54154.1 hypothetical protein GXP68_23025 [Ewingella americana]